MSLLILQTGRRRHVRRQRLKCHSENHGNGDNPPLSPDIAIITRCVRCGKPTCSRCEGTDNGMRDICDTCWYRIHLRLTALMAAEPQRHDEARRLARRWAARGRFTEVCDDYGIERRTT